MNYVKLILIAIISFFILNCDNPITSNQTSAKGALKKQGETSYMYGTHVLKNDDGKTIYALKSSSIKLDNYEDKYVCVEGKLVKDYPVDGGPNYLEVKDIKTIK